MVIPRRTGLAPPGHRASAPVSAIRKISVQFVDPRDPRPVEIRVICVPFEIRVICVPSRIRTQPGGSLAACSAARRTLQACHRWRRS